MDEKSQIQALDRTAPTLPMLPGTPERATHDYERNGTSSLYAALNVGSGEVISSLHQRHRVIEFLKFLKTIDATVPAHLDVHLVLDNACSHKTPKVRRWLAQHPRFVLHFTPTSSSWINLVERWFSELTTKLLRRGAHRSVRQLNSEIRRWIDRWNETPSRLCGPRQQTRSSTPSNATATELTKQDTRSASGGGRKERKWTSAASRGFSYSIIGQSVLGHHPFRGMTPAWQAAKLACDPATGDAGHRTNRGQWAR